MTCHNHADLRVFPERHRCEPGCVFDVEAVFKWACETPADMLDHSRIQTASKYKTHGVDECWFAC